MKHAWEIRNEYKIFVEKPEGRRPFARCRLDSSDSDYVPLAGSYEYGNEAMGSIKGREFYD
jgi:hypothetical protein